MKLHAAVPMLALHPLAPHSTQNTTHYTQTNHVHNTHTHTQAKLPAMDPAVMPWQFPPMDDINKENPAAAFRGLA